MTPSFGNITRWPLLKKAAKAIKPTDFNEYFELKRLLTNRHPTARDEFRVRFAKYYGLNKAFLTEKFKRKYFQLLFAFRDHGQKDPYTPLLITLYRYPRLKGDHSLQASFVSKLVAIHNETRPLYDVHVRGFFGVAPPSVGSIEFRIAGFVTNLLRIQAEYEAWVADPHFIRIVKPLLLKYPQLQACHPIRLCDFLVWKAGNRKLK